MFLMVVCLQRHKLRYLVLLAIFAVTPCYPVSLSDVPIRVNATAGDLVILAHVFIVRSATRFLQPLGASHADTMKLMTQTAVALVSLILYSYVVTAKVKYDG